MYPMSNDEINYERLIKILSLYRLTLGQARQMELLEYIFKECEDTEELKNLFIDLSLLCFHINCLIIKRQSNFFVVTLNNEFFVNTLVDLYHNF